jgi:hypothetical protein
MGLRVEKRRRQLGAFEAKDRRRTPEVLGLLAKRLAGANDPKKAARLRQRITRGFYARRSR